MMYPVQVNSVCSLLRNVGRQSGLAQPQFGAGVSGEELPRGGTKLGLLVEGTL